MTKNTKYPQITLFQRSEITRKTHMKLVHETINVREISFMKVMKFLVLVKLVS